MTSPSSRLSQAKSVFIVSSGNFLEMFDFTVFAYYAKAIGKTFFPASNELASIMLALMTFGAGFLMRPVGAIVLGAFIDRKGRRAGLLLTLVLMGVGTLSIACMPSYAQIGLLAPVLVVIGRLVQGLSAGAELGGVSVYLSEIAPRKKKGFYVAWQSASQQVAVVAAALVGLVLTSNLTPAEISNWGWRVPFFLGSCLLPFLFLIRRMLEESPAFQTSLEKPSVRRVLATIAANLPLVLLGSMMASMSNVFFYMITAYTPTYGSSVLHLSALAAMGVTLCVGLTNFVMVPTMGAVSDRVGRGPLLIGCSLTALITGYPALVWLTAHASFASLLAVELWLAVLYSAYNGAMIVFLTEIMPSKVRTSGFSLAYSLATAIFGGFTPALCTWLIAKTGDRAIPGAWLSLAALLGLVASSVLVARYRKLVRLAGLTPGSHAEPLAGPL